MKAWRALGPGAGIVVEDDARHIREMPDVWPPTPCLLGGVLRTQGIWKDENVEYFSSGKFMKVLHALQPGVVRIPGKWTMSVAYYLPPGFAENLLAQVTQASSFSCVDVWLNGFIKHAMYPNVFFDATAPSQCRSPFDNLSADLYMNRKGRALAKRFGATIEIGMPAEDYTAALSLAIGNIQAPNTSAGMTAGAVEEVD